MNIYSRSDIFQDQCVNHCCYAENRQRHGLTENKKTQAWIKEKMCLWKIVSVVL